MVLVHVDTVVMLTTSKTATSGMLSVLSNTTVTGGDVASLLAVLMFSGRLDNSKQESKIQRQFVIQVKESISS